MRLSQDGIGLAYEAFGSGTPALVGCGHFFPMEVPETVALLVERFLHTSPLLVG
jgi:hypothetical protein